MAEKKKFFEVEVPLIQSAIKLSAFKISDIENKFIKLDLTRMLKGKSIEATFKVHLENDKATGMPVKIWLFPFFIRRMMRRSTSYVEDSFLAETTDAVYRIKTFMITRKKVTRAVRKALRNKAKEYILEYVKEKDSNGVFEDVIDNKLQKSLSVVLKKIYPLALCEIKSVEKKQDKEGGEVEKIKAKKEDKPETKAEIKEEKNAEESKENKANDKEEENKEEKPKRTRKKKDEAEGSEEKDEEEKEERKEEEKVE